MPLLNVFRKKLFFYKDFKLASFAFLKLNKMNEMNEINASVISTN